jgi:hypothetical protein
MASAAAAVVAKARRDVISHFMQANAVSRDSAATWVPNRPLQQRMLERFLDRGVIVETGKDAYYLDLPEYDRWRRSIRRRLAFVVLGVSIAAAVLAAV